MDKMLKRKKNNKKGIKLKKEHIHGDMRVADRGN